MFRQGFTCLVLLWILSRFFRFRIRGFHTLWPAFPCRSSSRIHRLYSPVWALPRSLAATYGITFVFSSSGYLDVSVHRVPSFNLWIQLKVTRVFLAGLPHSEICGSIAYLQLTAAFRSLSRLSSALSAKASALRPI